ncbi:ATP-binding protein [Pseudomonas syringae]|uniref:LuxR family transcriptional regulator n=4 Tax=Pseudomonas syringae TaxID=317 RepID=A0A3M4K4M7_PSESF|nr:winged helix-turn-helix domain-containing protein [Pseudomonas syringae]EPM46870.1 LuxR family transcriptional regulator [Pseudomonas syringae pv. actinidiae ICMP 19098]EPN18131.1 LuxR family transcriptional regulator [Pseudomonas syringae pv. actinidiae ICMP 19100]EPN25695.1 LuxR family transcriptional regulator [Pseudomonas syringae pv. actinidiae ICMP 19099]EPN33386.1 LuxR family transcriptional regulator [Pseudomonas syringae pv. actinidiae ICMP 18883]EPN42316.1 LuxR family transcriptio
MDFEASGPGTMADIRTSESFQSQHAIRFGSFVLHPQQQLLFKNAQPVPLGSRAMSLLVAFATRPGELLEKAELLTLAWPRAVVEECNLRAQIVTLRRALEDQEDFNYIVTVPGRGYRFSAPVSVQPATLASPALAPRQDTFAAASVTKRQVLGRDELVRQLLELTLERRLLTLTGPGGVGKTTVALALADSLAVHASLSVAFVDLTPVTCTQPVLGRIAFALGLSTENEQPLRDIPASLAKRPQLLVLDNCEHILDETASAVEALLANAPLCCVVVTSREPLRAQGEWVHELGPLQVPDPYLAVSASQALGYSGVELFVTRVREQDPAFVFNDSDAAAVASICRKLDGNPLAIELAAARVRTFGITDLVGLLDGSFRLQMTGLRTALPRQRSLSATLDWTYGMLTGNEQALLRQLSIFNGSFTLDGVMAVVNIGLPDVRMTLPMLESLLDKSLLGTFDHSQGKRFRLLETTRLYAHEKLIQLDDVPRLCRTHAQWALRLLNQARLDLDHLSQDVWTQRYAAEIDTLRAALTWAFSAQGDRQLGVELTLSSAPLWLRLSLVREYQDWVNHGMPRCADEAQMDRRQRMRLLTMSGSILMLTYGAGQKMREVWQQVGEDAESLNDSEYRLRALWGQWNDHTCSKRHVQGTEVALRFLALGKDYRIADCQLMGRRMRATSAFYMGDMKTANQAIEEALGAPRSPSSHIIDMHFDQRIAAQSLRAQVQLLIGNTGQAMVALDTNVRQAITLSHPATLWYTLAISAIPATLIIGTLNRTRYFLDLLKQSSERQPLHIWRQLTRCYETILAIREGDAAQGVPLLGEALQQLRNHVETPLHTMLHTEYALGLAALKLEPMALEILDELHLGAVENHDRWYLPEIMRIKAQLMLSQPHTHSLEDVRKMLTQALEAARQDGTHFWAWRINTDLNRLKIAPGTPKPRHCPAVH